MLPLLKTISIQPRQRRIFSGIKKKFQKKEKGRIFDNVIIACLKTNIKEIGYGVGSVF
jgi:hypothetical protein